MTREELIEHLEHLEKYTHYSEDAPALREVIEMLKCSGNPNGSDTIYRQAAIDEITEYGSGNDIYMSVGELKRRIEALPPAQQDHSADVSKMVNGDVVSRREAINGKISIQRTNGVEMYSDEAVPVEYLKALPPAQPESIKCKDCGYVEERGCALFCGFWTRYTAHKGYCFKAERREDG